MRARSLRMKPTPHARLACAVIPILAVASALHPGNAPGATAKHAPAAVADTPAAAARGAPVADLEALAWIAGHWGGEAMGGRIEEGWFGPDGRSMSGSFRLVRDDLAIMYELLLLEQDDDGEIYYRFKHVRRGWTPVEETALEFRLTALEGRRATFRNTAAPPPESGLLWFTYESPAENELRVTIHGTGGGAPTVLAMTRR